MASSWRTASSKVDVRGTTLSSACRKARRSGKMTDRACSEIQYLMSNTTGVFIFFVQGTNLGNNSYDMTFLFNCI